ncbi:hypothetical protein JL720_16969 [Aureococcus anophagefferens]|nr:hypothetical protein JL720_16969 [Aureococcus anophagefferens]
MKSLEKTLAACAAPAHYVRCVRPNAAKSPDDFDARLARRDAGAAERACVGATSGMVYLKKGTLASLRADMRDADARAARRWADAVAAAKRAPRTGV